MRPRSWPSICCARHGKHTRTIHREWRAYPWLTIVDLPTFWLPSIRDPGRRAIGHGERSRAATPWLNPAGAGCGAIERDGHRPTGRAILAFILRISRQVDDG